MAFCVYLLASRRQGTLYLGVTGDIVRRVHEPAIAISREKELIKVAERLEDPADRGGEPRVARSLRNALGLTAAFVVPGCGAAASPEPMHTDPDTLARLSVSCNRGGRDPPHGFSWAISGPERNKPGAI